MNRFARFSLVALHTLLVVVPVSTTAQAMSDRIMSGDAIRAELTGKQLAGVYPSGLKWREMISLDGSSHYEEDAAPARPGRWWLSDADLCFTYATPGSGGCFQIVKQGANCYELYFVEPAEAQSTKPRSENRDWNGKLWREEEATTCEMPAV